MVLKVLVKIFKKDGIKMSIKISDGIDEVFKELTIITIYSKTPAFVTGAEISIIQ